MDVLNKSEIIRDPYNEPAFVENIAGVCSCIVLLELILFSPSLLNYLAENYECDDAVCKVFNKIASQETYNTGTFPGNLPYTFLKHEVMILAGLHKGNYSVLEEKPVFSFGSKSKKFNLADSSYCLYDFFRLFLEGERSMHSWKSNPRLTLKKGNDFILGFKNRKALKHLENCGSKVNFDETCKKLDNYFKRFDYSNWWNIILIHVFFDPEDVGDDRVTIKMFSPNKPPEEFRAFESYLPMEIEDAIFYYPTIKMMFILIPIQLHARDFNFHSFIKFAEQVYRPSFNEKILREFPWVRRVSNNIIKQYGYPNIVIAPVSSREEMTQMYRLHPSVLFEMKNRILQIIEVVENNFPHINMSEIERIVPSFEKNEIILVDHHAGLSHQYWNGNKFATQQLFRNFNRGKQGKNYKVYGMSLGISKHSIRIVNELVKIHNRHIARYLDNNIMKLYHRYAAIKRFNGSFLAKKLVRKRALRIISDVLYYQTYTSVDLYNAHKNKLYGSGFPKLFETEPFEENFVHLMVLIRSLNDEDNWYFIDNDEITIVKDVKSFVRDGYGFNYIDSMYWHEEESYGLNRKLKEYIKPFLLKDYMGKGLVGSTTTSTTTSE